MIKKKLGEKRIRKMEKKTQEKKQTENKTKKILSSQKSKSN